MKKRSLHTLLAVSNAKEPLRMTISLWVVCHVLHPRFYLDLVRRRILDVKYIKDS